VKSNFQLILITKLPMSGLAVFSEFLLITGAYAMDQQFTA